MSPEFVAISMFAFLFVAIFIGHPLAFSLGALALFFGFFGWGGDLNVFLAVFSNKIFGLMSDYVLVAVPLFIFMAQLMNASGIAESLFTSMYVVLGPIRGGLGLAVIVVSTVFAASAGVVGATEVAIGLLAAPALLKRGYNIPLDGRRDLRRRHPGHHHPPQHHAGILRVHGQYLRGPALCRGLPAGIFPGGSLHGLHRHPLRHSSPSTDRPCPRRSAPTRRSKKSAWSASPWSPRFSWSWSCWGAS